MAVGTILASLLLSVVSTERCGIVALNQDVTEMQYRLAPGEENAAGVRKYFDSVSKGGLTHFLINPNAHNAGYASEVWDPVWHRDPRLKERPLKQFENSRVLHENGVDWVQVMIDACREQGVSPWLSMRMNDIHSIGERYSWSNSKFWLDHPELRRKPGSEEGGAYSADLAFDFTHRAVREHALALAREMLGKWDVDGFECDWLRFPHHVNDAAELDRTGCAALTEYMREMRRLADEAGRRRGKRLLVGVRVAAMPEAALGLGTDAVAWAREGLVDWVAPCNFFSCLDFALPFDEWKSRLAAANPNVRLVGGLDFAGVDREGTGPRGVLTSEFCGYLERMTAAGVRDFECFNRFAYSEGEVNRYVQIEGMPDMGGWARRHDRSYPVTFHDAVPKGYDADRRLPTGLKDGRAFAVSVGRVGRASSAGVVLAFDGIFDGDLAACVTLNGASAVGARAEPLASWVPGARRAKSAYRVGFPVRALRDGVNEIRLRPCPTGRKLHFATLLVGKDEPGGSGAAMP